MAAKHLRPGSGIYPLACLDEEKPPTVHHDHYVWGTCGCKLCATWKERLDLHAEAAQAAEGHNRSCMCKMCKAKRATLIQLLVAENIRDLWSEISWIAQGEGWSADWPEWLMEELRDPTRSVGWYSSSCSHYPMAFWTNRYAKWKENKGA